MQSCLTK
ncbi:hypothetical protein LEMLEM_LOCUS4109 [Lemmus lemmus]